MKFAIWFDNQLGWWPTFEEAQQEATQLFAQNMKYVDAIHVYGEGDFVNPVWTIAREGYCGPSPDARLAVKEREGIGHECV